MTDCDPPRCFHVKERCQCPNSWIEYLSKEAKDRRNSGLPRLSIKRYAANYRKLKRSGKFKTGKPTKECRGIDTDTLCRWNLKRSGSTREPTGDLSAFLKLKDPSIRAFPGQPEIKTGIFKGVSVIIKVQNIKEVGKDEFLYTTKVHTLMAEHIPRSVPKLYKAYFLHSPKGLHGIHIMEYLPGITMKKYLERKNRSLSSLARALKVLLMDLRTCKVVHTDLHDDNIILDLDRQGRVKNAKAIDLERTFIFDTVGAENAISLFQHVIEDPPSPPPALILEMLKVDHSLPREMQNWEDYDFQRLADAIPRTRTYHDLPRLETFKTSST